jgi:hypothetical protein
VLSYTLIKTSRTYKELKRKDASSHQIYKKELVLKLVSIGVIFGTILFFLIRHL